jgi:hypothetical protein
MFLRLGRLEVDLGHQGLRIWWCSSDFSASTVITALSAARLLVLVIVLVLILALRVLRLVEQ